MKIIFFFFSFFLYLYILLLETKTANLCGHLKRSGVSVRQSLFFSRVIFLSPDCELNEELRKRKELVSPSQIDDFLKSFREGYMAWISDALTPSWLSGEWILEIYTAILNIQLMF